MTEIEYYELKEMIERLKKTKYKRLLEILLNEDVYTSKGKLNKTKFKRIANIKEKQMVNMFSELREEFNYLIS